jgi:hypothetical protein
MEKTNCLVCAEGWAALSPFVETNGALPDLCADHRCRAEESSLDALRRATITFFPKHEAPAWLRAFLK